MDKSYWSFDIWLHLGLQKKFIALTHENQYRHTTNWLTAFYQKLVTNRVSPTSLDLFYSDCQKILEWAGIAPFHKPDTHDIQLWIEFVSDTIHLLRQKTGVSPKRL